MLAYGRGSFMHALEDTRYALPCRPMITLDVHSGLVVWPCRTDKPGRREPILQGVMAGLSVWIECDRHISNC